MLKMSCDITVAIILRVSGHCDSDRCNRGDLLILTGD